MSDQEKQRKGDFVVNFFKILITIGNVLHYLILFVPIETRFLYLFLSTVKVVNVAHYHITIQSVISTILTLVALLYLYNFLVEQPQVFTYSN